MIRGKPVKTTVSDQAQPCPLDRVTRQFHAERPNALWVSDFTYVSTWQGMVYVAFVIDVYARRIVGWHIDDHGLRARCPGAGAARPAAGDSYDNALAETINGLYRAEVIHRRSWRNRQQVELATLDWVDWFNHKRLLGPIGHVPPAEAEAAYDRQQASQARAA